MEKKLIIFANSVKHHEHCIAGKCVETQQWIRPVSSTEGSELSYSQICIEDINNERKETQPLDVVQISFTESCPLIYQPENHLIEDKEWIRIEQHTEIPEIYLDNPEDIWGIGRSISDTDIVNGTFQLEKSLLLVKVDNLQLYTNDFNGRRKRRANFKYNDTRYDLPVTSHNFDHLYDNGITPNESILCISLGEMFQGEHFKIIAGIF